jgi:adenine/guanine phosphoribosyltransferase-like PRPP-binding protein
MNHTPVYNHSEYLEQLVQTDKLLKSVNDALDILDAEDFDSIAFRGISGALIAPILALLMGKTLCAVRKPQQQELSHGCKVEGDANTKRFIIVDDFIASGSTVYEILKEIALFAPKAVCVGFYSVRDKRFARLSQLRDERFGLATTLGRKPCVTNYL